MIAGRIHEGSGLGDQLFRYITVRTLADKMGVDWGMIGSLHFKGESFLNIDMGKSFLHEPGEPITERSREIAEMIDYSNVWNEKEIRDSSGNDIRSYDPEINFVQDSTIIDGSFEDDKYWRHNLKNINEWLKVETLEVPDDTCIIGFRGGEYASQPDLFLGKDYYDTAIQSMVEKGIGKFQVHTDDPTLAKKFFPDFEVIENTPISHSKHSSMGFNWRSARFAKHAIIPNSAFFILPRTLKQFEDPTAVTIAPRYWARHNTKTWARPACYYPEFTYV